MKVKVTVNSAGVVAMLKSNEMQEILKAQADAALSSLGEGYSQASVMSTDRAKVFVTADTFQARKENAKNNTLLKALKGGAKK